MCHLCPFIITWVPGPNLDGFFPRYFFERATCITMGMLKGQSSSTKNNRLPAPNALQGPSVGGKFRGSEVYFKGDSSCLGRTSRTGNFRWCLESKIPSFFIHQMPWKAPDHLRPKDLGDAGIVPSVLLEELVHFNMQQFFSCNHRLSSVYVRFKHDQVPCVGWVMLGC